eukprot:SAG31_NODE_24210_length_486_cov_1.984496_1_plen_162_part_11
MRRKVVGRRVSQTHNAFFIFLFASFFRITDDTIMLCGDCSYSSYGWGFNCEVPEGEIPARLGGTRGKRVWRALGTSYGFVCPYGLANGLLLTGDQKYVDCWRTTLEVVASNAKTVGEKTLYPLCYSDDPRMGQTAPDWCNWSETPLQIGALEVWYWSQDPKD